MNKFAVGSWQLAVVRKSFCFSFFFLQTAD